MSNYIFATHVEEVLEEALRDPELRYRDGEVDWDNVTAYCIDQFEEKYAEQVEDILGRLDIDVPAI